MGGKESFETSVDNVEKVRKSPQTPGRLGANLFCGTT